MPSQTQTDPASCPVCGQRNQCMLANPATATRPCWCFGATFSSASLANPLASSNRNACLCPACAQAPAPTASDAP